MRSLYLNAAWINVCLFTCFVNLHLVMATKQKAHLVRDGLFEAVRA